MVVSIEHPNGNVDGVNEWLVVDVNDAEVQLSDVHVSIFLNFIYITVSTPLLLYDNAGLKPKFKVKVEPLKVNVFIVTIGLVAVEENVG